MSKGITDKYSREISKITNKLNALEQGRFYDPPRNNSKMDGYLAHNLQEVRKMFNELLIKIDTEAPSINDQLKETFKEK
ncbi:hypothetical protein [Virgibacillus halodenitrificans]|uniref:Uncharacterized protein n=1 Tax=Virgibacillus halodenitrificans TaxID=1482 RepID=A0ABR7VSH7_VIRHA|nr:hypothetical protein [Virgibacillus halodenitrificans]MBD1224805.1 hypothetical protein [Virgibacillus halodenitrificans]